MDQKRATYQEMLAALCLIGDGEKGKDLFAFASLRDHEGLLRIADRICRDGEIHRKEILGRIQRTRRLSGFSALQEIHPGWIAEKLGGESPRLFGLLCRFLPGDKVRYLIHQLSGGRSLTQWPKMNESYRVAPEIVEIVRRLIEVQLTPPVSLPEGDSFSFFHIARMKGDDVRVLFWDLGLEEIRRAFQGVEPRVLRAFLSRFSPKEAGEISGRIRHGANVPGDRRRSAQRHLVSLPLGPVSAGDLLREIGYSVFAQALSPEEGAFGELVCEKLSPEEGYRLKRVIQESVASRGIPSQGVPENKEEILGRLSWLAEKGIIRRYWKEGDELTSGFNQREAAA